MMASICRDVQTSKRQTKCQFSTKQFQFNDFFFHEKIGQGGSGTVTRVTFKKPYLNHKEAAVKNVLELRKKEIEILSSFNHGNIVVLYGYIQMGPLNMIVLEYAPLGSVRDYIKNNHCKPVGSGLLFKWLKESALALQHLHDNHVIHRDIKGANCVLFEGQLLKLADFGFARYIDESMTTSSAKGTWRYMAPEINSENHFSFASDLYSYGMLAIEMVSGMEPFEGLEWQHVVYQVVEINLTPVIPHDCPKLVEILMRQCWSKDPKDRPTANDVVDILHSDHTARFDDLRLVVFGLEGAGKTDTSRNIIFPCKADATAVPKHTSRMCKRIQGEVFGTKISIVKIPGHFGNNPNKASVKNSIAQFNFLSTPGPHAFLMVIRINSPAKQVQDMTIRFCRFLGDNVLKHTIVVFTGQLHTPITHLRLSAEEYINDNKEVQLILNDCHNRFVVFDNMCKDDSQKSRNQVSHLLSLISRMIQANGGKRINTLIT